MKQQKNRVKMQHVVLFEKWRDPFFDEETHTNGELIDPEDMDVDPEFNPHYAQPEEIISHNPTPFIPTQLGPMSVPEYSQPSKVYNFWVGHTNVVITHKVLDAIKRTAGVEVLTPFSQYRFRVGIGKLFQDSVVLRDIRKSILKEAAASAKRLSQL